MTTIETEITLDGGQIMKVSVSELKSNVGRYIDLAELQDIFITKNGKQVAKIVSTKINKVAAMEAAFDRIPADTDLDQAKAARLLLELFKGSLY